jgi:methylmalonyl-CoA mutase cobalamin-binding domain/chain
LGREDIVQEMEKAFLQADLKAARRLMVDVAEEHGYEALIFRVLEPAMVHLGEVLERHEVSLAQTYVASMIVDEALRRHEDSAAGSGRPGAARKGPVVLGNIEDDCHPLGRKIVASFLRLNGWDVRDLGIDVEAGTLVDEAVLVGAKVIGVSAMIFSAAKNIRKVRDEIDRRGLTGVIMLAVGGAVFRLRPELVEEVGGDGTAANAFAAVSLFERLWKQAERGRMKGAGG